MMNETNLTVIGNLTADPELRFTQSGVAVANFTVASTPRTFDRASGQWRDGEALFMRCSIWREAAENVASSLTKGMRVVVTGRIQQRSYQDREGNNRTVVEMTADEVAPSLRFATAQVTRAARQGGGPGSSPAPTETPARGGGGYGGSAPAAQESPWATPGSADGWALPGDEDTPF
ncbi:single-stranded DNA-binding protein [Microbacterium sp. YY-01]|uniref:single-stranded DNA-binding protein n=1 Tax=Microbacterium sp. YY-01 TaxID=3421634 RepID=UPI003D181AB5